MGLPETAIIALNILAVMFLLIGSFQNFRMFYRTSFTEFFYLFLLFFLSLLAVIVVLLPIEELNKIRIFYFLSALSYLPFLLFGHRIKKFAKGVLYGTFIFGFILAISTLFWVPLNGSNRSFYWKFNIAIFQINAGIVYNNWILISSNFNAPLTLFRLFISAFLLYSMMTVEEIKEIPKMRLAKILWELALLFGVIHDILFLTGPSFWTGIFLNLSLFFSIFIVTVIPEGIILTKMQLLSIYKNVTLVVSQEQITGKRAKGSEIYNYILEVKKIIENEI